MGKDGSPDNPYLLRTPPHSTRGDYWKSPDSCLGIFYKKNVFYFHKKTSPYRTISTEPLESMRS